MIHHPVIDAPSLPPPGDRQLPLGTTAFPITADGVLLHFAGGVGASHLRISCAIDTRDERRIAVHAADGRRIGALTVAYACPYEVFELPLPPDDAATIAADGCRLRLEDGPAPLWTIGSCPGHGGEVLMPHLLSGTAVDHWAALRDRLASVAGLHPFGWLWGCVAAGLEDLHHATGEERYRLALREQATRFWRDGGIEYDDPDSRPRRDFHSIEATLPLAIMERVLGPGPGDVAIAFWRSCHRSDGVVCSGRTLSTEGSYTIAWPMAELGMARNDAALRTLAVDQVRHRFRVLVHAGRIHQCGTVDGADLRLPDWARGVAWQLLGCVRTLAALPESERPADVIDALRRESARVAALQDTEGLWSNFVGEAYPADASGAAGIAAAFALGAHAGLLSGDFLSCARRTQAGLGGRLTPDGLLSGCAQLNRGGEALQRSDYRVISQMGMGLAAQLDAALLGG